MPPTRKTRAKRQAKQPAKRPAVTRGRGGPRAGSKPASSRGKNDLRCPDCDFVAAHPMGLGRHRSARHGILSGRQRRRESSGAWLTRREAARRAGVHYNTIRHWERTGRLRRSKSGSARGAMVSALDLDGLVRGGGRVASGGAPDMARIDALERRFNELVAGLERLVASARGGGSGTRRGKRR
jgi:MerR-like DNA binding protein